MRPDYPARFVLSSADDDSRTKALPLLPAIPILPKRTVLPACDRRVTPIPSEFKLQLPPYPRELPPYAFHPAFTPGPPPKPICVEVNAIPIRVKYRPINTTIKRISPRRVSTQVFVEAYSEHTEKVISGTTKSDTVCTDIVLRHVSKVEKPKIHCLTIVMPHLLSGMDILWTDTFYLSKETEIKTVSTDLVMWNFEVPRNTEEELTPPIMETSTIEKRLGKTPSLSVVPNFRLEFKPLCNASKQIALILIAVALSSIIPTFASMHRSEQQLSVRTDAFFADTTGMVTDLVPRPVNKKNVTSNLFTTTLARHVQSIYVPRDVPFKSLPVAPTKTKTNETNSIPLSQAVIKFLPLALIESVSFAQATLKIVATLLVTGVLVALQ